MSHTAIVILNYNGEKFLQQFLPPVLEYSGAAEVIIADNASTDLSLPVLKAQFPGVRIISLEKNYGFCGGYNHSLRQVRADYYVLLNSDVEVTPGWLEPMVSLLDQNPGMGAVQPKILSYSHRDRFEYAGAGGGFIDSFGYPFCRGRVFDSVENDEGQYNDTRNIFWATGACLVIRANLFHHFEGLDEDFFAHMEEIDLCWKIQRAGHSIGYCGESTVFHVGAGTLGYKSPKKTYLNFRNGLSMITKHFDPWEILIKLPVRIALDWLAGVMFLVKGEASHSMAIFRAHVDYLRTLKHTWRKRTILRKQYPSYPRNNVYAGLVLLSYFLSGKRKFF